MRPLLLDIHCLEQKQQIDLALKSRTSYSFCLIRAMRFIAILRRDQAFACFYIIYNKAEMRKVQLQPASSSHSMLYLPIGSKVTFPSLPILAVLIVGALIVTGVVTFFWPVGSLFASESVTTGCTIPGCASAISLTSWVVSTSLILEARVCSKIVVGP